MNNEKAQARLHHVRARIAAHPLMDPRMQEARRIVKESRVEDRRLVTTELRERNLPTMRQQVMTMIVGLPSLARLNRERIKLEDKLNHRTS